MGTQGDKKNICVSGIFKDGGCHQDAASKPPQSPSPHCSQSSSWSRGSCASTPCVKCSKAGPDHKEQSHAKPMFIAPYRCRLKVKTVGLNLDMQGVKQNWSHWSIWCPSGWFCSMRGLSENVGHHLLPLFQPRMSLIFFVWKESGRNTTALSDLAKNLEIAMPFFKISLQYMKFTTTSLTETTIYFMERNLHRNIYICINM